MRDGTLAAIVRTLCVVAGAALCMGCGAKDTKADGIDPEASIVAVEVTGEGEVERFDLNGDGNPDVSKVFTVLGPATGADGEKRRVLARSELDVNFDGKVDMRQFFNKDGAMVREEMDLDFDGRTDAIDHYVGGTLYKRELFLNFNERPSVWKYFEEGRLVRKERDTDGTGKPDVFEYFDKDKLIRVGFDRNGDAKPDYYEESEDEPGATQ